MSAALEVLLVRAPLVLVMTVGIGIYLAVMLAAALAVALLAPPVMAAQWLWARRR